MTDDGLELNVDRGLCRWCREELGRHPEEAAETPTGLRRGETCRGCVLAGPGVDR